MINLNLPAAELKMRQRDDASEVFDPLRKRYVALTDEEWVRQHLIAFLASEKKVPLHMMSSEKRILVNRLPKRFDILVYAKQSKPVMIVECKAPHIAIDEEVFYQAARYNLTLQVKYLLLSNGLEHHCAQIDYVTGKIALLSSIPSYHEMD